MSDPTDLEILEGPPPEPPAHVGFSPSWLVATGQDHYLRWMMLATLAGVGIGALRWAGGTALLSFPPLALVVLGGVAAILICGGLLLPLILVRCRACGCRVALFYIRHSHFSRWMYDLQAATGCPKCGDHPQVHMEEDSP